MKIHRNITCKELFETMHKLTSIPQNLLRITMGSLELYQKEEKLSCIGEPKLIVTLKLRLRGGVRDTKNKS